MREPTTYPAYPRLRNVFFKAISFFWIFYKIMAAFHTFLFKECSAIQALLQSSQISKNEMDCPIVMRIEEVNSEIQTFLQTMECNVPLLEEVITTYRFKFDHSDIPNLIEVVRMLDILGAEVRYREYGFILYQTLNELDFKYWLPYAVRIPVSFESLTKIFGMKQLEGWIQVCHLGSKPLLQFISTFPDYDKQETFMKLCEFGHFELAFEFDHDQILSQLHLQQRQHLFQIFCQYGQLTIAQRQYKDDELDYDVDAAFLIACEHGQLEVCQWLYSFRRKDMKDYEDKRAFVIACSNGHVSITQWLLEMYDINNFNFEHSSVYFDYSYELSTALEHPEMENWLYHNNILPRSSDRVSQIFCKLCCSGNLSIIQRFYQSFSASIDIHYLSDQPFVEACHSGNLELVQWLYGLGNINIHTDRETPFLRACESNLEIVKWLYSLDGQIDVYINDSEAFRYACWHGDLTIAQWLFYEVEGGSQQIKLHPYIFQGVFDYGHLHVIQWLCSLGGFEKAIESNAVAIALRRGYVFLACWLYEKYDELHHNSLNDS
jgi:hypothetical protein